MFVHINPELNAIGETISTLKFAERVASIELGAARSNKETGEIRELKDEISNLKQQLERKESEIEQMKRGSTRSVAESQRTRAVSPFYMPNVKPETFQRPNDDTKISEARSCSSGKQRRSRFPSSSGEQKVASSIKPRSPSPPVRGSISTDRGSIIKSRVKVETVEHQPVARVPFPARVPVNKSIPTMPALSSTEINSKLPYTSSLKQDNIYNFQNVCFRKVYPEHEEEQFREALNIRQGGIRKNKNECKNKPKHQQIPTRFHKFDAGITMLADMDAREKMEESRKSDFSEPENEQVLPESPMLGALRVKKVQNNLSRNFQNLNSQNFETRGAVQGTTPLFSGMHENKLANGITREAKEGGNTSMPEFRRSRSTPRGKFLVLP